MKKTAFLLPLVAALVFPGSGAARGSVPGVPDGSIDSDTSLYEHRPFQFTFLFPPLSTNGIHNGHIVNDVSLNLFIGVSGGVESFEAGGFINIDRYYMNGLQLAGFGNNVGGAASGVQVAGFYNVAGTDLEGVQGAGFINLNGGDVTGLQASGFANISGGELNGVQASGLLNVTGRAGKAVQGAGFGNVAGEGKTHLQAAGFFNVAGEVDGLQAAGFLNVAGNVKGVQLTGFINYCDSIDGVPLGLINVVRKNGYRRFGYSVSEVQYANLQFRMGVGHLYTIYSFGKPFGPASRWMYGAGLGTEIDLQGRSVLSIEGTVEQELWIGNPAAPRFLTIDRLNLHNSLKFLFGWYVERNFSLFLGPTFNVSVAESNPDIGHLPYHEIAPYAVYNRTRPGYSQIHTQIWFGIRGGIRF